MSQTPAILRQLDADLILRSAMPADADALAEFNSQIHGDPEANWPDPGIAAWTHDLLARPHPTLQAADFTIVEEVSSGRIVSSLNLIPQTWAYDGIPFAVGRPELVGTLSEYRGRGLVRAQFELIHQWSAERGHLLQAITGIPYYYRLFGYEMALNLDGWRGGLAHELPAAKPEAEAAYRIRPAIESDLPFILEVYAQACRRWRVSCVWDLDLLRYELLGKSSGNVNRLELRLIESAAGEAVGYLAHPGYRWGSNMGLRAFEIKAGATWAAVTPAVLSYLRQVGESYQPYRDQADFRAFILLFGEAHPVYELLPRLLPRRRPPYAWYVRIPDLPGFLRHIAPALERRLEDSLFAGYSGELKLTFYRSGLRLGFEAGKLTAAEAWQPFPQGHSGDAAFPGLTFLQLLLGYRSLAELRYAFPDCWVEQEQTQPLLETLFPRQPSDLWGVS